MIFGVGMDVVQLSRVEKVWNRFGSRFPARVLLAAERRQLSRTANPVRFLAMRFAAKEAIVKAMGTGFANGMWVRDVGSVASDWGQPRIVYSPRGEAMRERLGIGEGYLTLTDEAGLVIAMAVLMKSAGPGAAECRQADLVVADVRSGAGSVRPGAAEPGPSMREPSPPPGYRP